MYTVHLHQLRLSTLFDKVKFNFYQWINRLLGICIGVGFGGIVKVCGLGGNCKETNKRNFMDENKKGRKQIGSTDKWEKKKKERN